MPVSPIEPGAMLAHYRLVERLGEGGMGVVWKAIDTTLDREVAIKILPERLALHADRRARFEREAKLLASLNHPNIAAIYGLHESDGVRFLAMELVRGGSLTREIAAGLTVPRALDLALGIAEGLAAAHRQHVVHRDLKPDNIVIDAEGHPKILDFGLAKLAAESSSPDAATALRDPATTGEGSILGTVAYMSPEQAQGLPVDARSDVFSFGIVLYEMLTRRRPFGGANNISIISSILRDTPEPVTQLAPSAPAPLQAIVERCLAKKPEDRFEDASALRDGLRAVRDGLVSRGPRRSLYASAGAAAAVLLVVLAIAGVWWHQRTGRERWLRKEALPQLETVVDRIQGLEEGRESWDAFMLARRIDAVAPRDPLVERLRPRFTREISITSEPPGATVTAKFYDDPDAPPVLIGRTPLPKIRYPRGFTRVHLELPGYTPVDDVIWNFALVGDAWKYQFHRAGEVPPDMSWIPGGAFELYIPGLDHLKAETTAAYLMDRHEVTNREFKRFVDAGGYSDPKYWRLPFVDDGRALDWKDAVARFTDRTGRPGPATWEVGSYPEGQANYPVGGVSWYEAAAYAEWAGKSLPTIFHWNRVAFTVASARIVPQSNLAGKGPRPVGSTRSMNRWGVSDLAGNVREWTWNATDNGRNRFILGGGWNDPDYSFVDAYAQPPFDRSPTNGFRCIRTIGNDPHLAQLQRDIVRPFRDFMKEKPVPDEVFAQYLRQFAYDKTPLNARIEEEERTPTGIRQKVTFDAAYGGERMMAYVFLPPGGRKPYQTVIIFPGSGVIEMRSSKSLELGRTDFLLRSGRAVVHPIYKGTFERGGDLHTDYPSETAFWKDYVIMWGKDLGRTIDYIETRPDLDASRIAYYGLSWGAELGAILPAVEKRIKVNVLYVAGLGFQRALPEVDAINYIGRVKQPTLILNGQLDFFFPAETSQKPMFELLGTPPQDKKRLVFTGGHSVPRTETIKESLLWLDHYLGTPAPQSP